MFFEPMIHDLIVSLPEDAQGGEASDVMVPTQVHLLGTVNLQEAIHTLHYDALC